MRLTLSGCDAEDGIHCRDNGFVRLNLRPGRKCEPGSRRRITFDK